LICRRVQKPRQRRFISTSDGLSTTALVASLSEKILRVSRVPRKICDENFDVGADPGTPVDDNDYRVPFKFTGKLNKLTLTIDRPKLSPEEEEMLMMEGQRNKKASE
jgi:hypothetical protein